MNTGPFSQPNYPGFPPPHVRPRRGGNVRSVVAAVFAALAAAALVVGSFLPSLKIQSFADGALAQTLTITSWGRTFDPPPTGSVAQAYAVSHVPLYGIPLAVIAAGLLVAAGVALARPPRAGRTALIAAAAATLGATFMLAMDIESSLSYSGADPTPGATTDYTIGIGSWTILGGAVLALLAALFALGRTGRVDEDPTPPQGFPAPGYWVPSGYPPPQYYAPPPGYPAAPPRTPPPGFPPPRQPAGPVWPREEVRQHTFPAADDTVSEAPQHGVLDPGPEVTSRLNPAERDQPAQEHQDRE